jgi:pilus assembly protein CpaC
LFTGANFRGISRPITLTLAALLVSVSLSATVQAIELLRVVEGKSRVLQHHEKIRTVSIADQEVADVVSITATEMVIIGKSVGTTSLAVWGESGNYVEFDIEVDRNVTGKQIVLEVQVAEVNRTSLAEYGFDFLILDHDGGIASGEQTVGSYIGGVVPPNDREIVALEGVTAVLKWIADKQEVSSAVRMLQKRGNLTLLANPRLVSFSGKDASFLVGGEFPVPIAQSISSGGAPTYTIEWKEYGVRLDFTPTIIDTNLINLVISPEVSSLDWANAVTFAGGDIPSLRTRKANATVELNSNQSLVLGGLLSSETFENKSRVPILGHIPLLGFFFTHKETNTVETELLIIVSPRIIDVVENEVIPPIPGVEVGAVKPVAPQQQGKAKGK